MEGFLNLAWFVPIPPFLAFVAIILFEGGLTLKFSELREAGVPVLRLCTIGVFVALAAIALCARAIFDFDWPVVLALDLMSSSDDSRLTDAEGVIQSTLTTDVDILEFDVGVRKRWGKKARPYIGGGLAIARVEGKIVEQLSFGGDMVGPPNRPKLNAGQ